MLAHRPYGHRAARGASGGVPLRTILWTIPVSQLALYIVRLSRFERFRIGVHCAVRHQC